MKFQVISVGEIKFLVYECKFTAVNNNWNVIADKQIPFKIEGFNEPPTLPSA